MSAVSRPPRRIGGTSGRRHSWVVLAIVLPVLVGVIVSGDVLEHGTLVACAALIALVGLLDDLVTLSPATKLVAQIALASLFVFMGYRLHWVESLTLDSLLTLFWVVGITNAFNLAR